MVSHRYTCDRMIIASCFINTYYESQFMILCLISVDYFSLIRLTCAFFLFIIVFFLLYMYEISEISVFCLYEALPDYALLINSTQRQITEKYYKITVSNTKLIAEIQIKFSCVR